MPDPDKAKTEGYGHGVKGDASSMGWTEGIVDDKAAADARKEGYEGDVSF